jgi:hypothetical protein
MKQLEVVLTESDAKIVLEALVMRERALAEFCASSTDGDAVADAGNDLVELRLLLTTFRDGAVAKFGAGVLNFDRTAL